MWRGWRRGSSNSTNPASSSRTQERSIRWITTTSRQSLNLKRNIPFWLHVDGAFGGFAAISPKTAHLVKGWEHADSVTVDNHKWLNVPYDSGVLFTRHRGLQTEVFQNAAVYLGNPSDEPNFVPPDAGELEAFPRSKRLDDAASVRQRGVSGNC